MAYQGEDWVFTLKGDSQINLDSADFKVLIYPCGKPDTPIMIEKSACSRVESNTYSGKVSYESTKTLATGYYSFEVLLITDGSERSVFVKDAAFYNNPSASKNI